MYVIKSLPKANPDCSFVNYLCKRPTNKLNLFSLTVHKQNNSVIHFNWKPREWLINRLRQTISELSQMLNKICHLKSLKLKSKAQKCLQKTVNIFHSIQADTYYSTRVDNSAIQ